MASAPPPEYLEKEGPPLDNTQPLLSSHPSSETPPTAPPQYHVATDSKGHDAEKYSPYPPPQAGPGYPPSNLVQPDPIAGNQPVDQPQGHSGYPYQGHPAYQPQGNPGYPSQAHPSQAHHGYPPQGHPGYPPQGQVGYPPRGQVGYPQPGNPDYSLQGQQQPTAVSYAVGAQTVALQPGERLPNDYLCFSIFNIVCCCCCLGIVALTKSLAVRRHVNLGSLDEARRESANALRWNKISLGIGIVVIVCWVAAVVTLNVISVSWYSDNFIDYYDYN